MLYEQGRSTVNDLINVAAVISHELAHMYFGNLVTPVWWTYLWLTEGMATLFEYYAVQPAYPELRMNDLFVVNVLHRILRADATGYTRPMTYYVESPAAIEGIFDGISYSKAGSVFRMLMYSITENTFRKVMQIFLDTNKNTAVNEKPLYAALEEAIQADLSAPFNIIDKVMDSWSLQGGYPLVSATRTGDQLTLRQEEFVASVGEVNSDKSWWIPITFAHKSDPSFANTDTALWMNDKEHQISHGLAEDEWFILNVQQVGYYRVNYDTHSWQLLIDELNKGDHTIFPPTNRAQMVDDINVLANTLRTAPELRLALMEYLQHETDMLPLIAAQAHLLQLNKMLAPTGAYPLFKKYLTRIVATSYAQVDKYYYADADVNTFKSRPVLVRLACTIGLAECQSLTRTLMFSELVTGTAIINKEDRELFYCQGLKTANSRLFRLALDKFEQLFGAILPIPNYPDLMDYSQIEGLARVIGCYGDAERIALLVESLFKADFPYQRYRYIILRSIITNGHVDLVLHYLVDNLQTLDDL